MPGWSDAWNKRERAFLCVWREKENGDEIVYSIIVCVKKIHRAKTHSHTNAEQMSSVQCGLNEPWMIWEASGDACPYLFRDRLWLGHIWYLPPPPDCTCALDAQGQLWSKLQLQPQPCNFVPMWFSSIAQYKRSRPRRHLLYTCY